jgi:hypothetical protein
MGSLQLLRHRLAARALRLGYNVFSHDADVFYLQDPYLFFKKPPFSQYQLITQQESSGINVGVMYMHNMSRRGPAAWLVAETADRMLRWADQDGAFLK